MVGLSSYDVKALKFAVNSVAVDGGLLSEQKILQSSRLCEREVPRSGRTLLKV